MAIDTTVSINFGNFNELCFLSDKYNISKSKVVSLIIKILSNRCASIIKNRFSTQYQVNDPGNFRRLHIYLSEPDFSVAADLRRFSHSSFSLLIAEVLKKYYNELIILLEGSDNYPHQIHCQIYSLEGKTTCWRHYWGMPPEEELKTG